MWIWWVCFWCTLMVMVSINNFSIRISSNTLLEFTSHSCLGLVRFTNFWYFLYNKYIQPIVANRKANVNINWKRNILKSILLMFNMLLFTINNTYIISIDHVNCENCNCWTRMFCEDKMSKITVFIENLWAFYKMFETFWRWNSSSWMLSTLLNKANAFFPSYFVCWVFPFFAFKKRVPFSTFHFSSEYWD